MKKIIQLLLLVKCTFLHSQNIIKNSSFELLPNSLSAYNCDITGNCAPFSNASNSYVYDWKSYLNTPEIYQSSQNSIYEGNAAAYFKMFQSNGNVSFNEGIFQENLSIKKNKIYSISINYWIRNNLPSNSNNVSLKLIAANNLVNTNATLNNTIPFEEIGVSSNNSFGQWLQFNTTYKATDNFSQIAIFAVPNPNVNQVGSTQAEIVIDNVIITESCCISDITFTNTINPPSVKAQDFIKFGPDVLFINNSSSNFNAKNEILLANNTTIVDVNYFVAQAEDCLNRPIEFYQQIVEVHESNKCSFRVFLSACYGSGQYAFYFGEELSTDKYKDYPIENAGSTITVKVVDLVTGEIIIKSISLPNNPHFSDAIHVTIPNVFTPNGDGKNDYFRITDNNKTSYAYNATWFYLQIWNRWGNNVLEQRRELTGDDINGFSDDAIYWKGRVENDDNNPIVAADTYYYLFEIGNCNPNSTKTYRGSITLIKSSFKEETGINDQINSNANFPSEIYPNPTADNLSLRLYNVTKNSQITITDILGKQLNIDCKLVENKNGIQEYNIDCSLLSNGIYFCNINKNGITENIKFSVIK